MLYGNTNHVIYTWPKWWLSDTYTSLNLYERWYNVPNNPSLKFKPDLALNGQVYGCGEIRVYFGNFFVKRWKIPMSFEMDSMILFVIQASNNNSVASLIHPVRLAMYGIVLGGRK